MVLERLTYGDQRDRRLPLFLQLLTKKLLSLVTRNSPSLLTVYNQVEILQDVTEKYPRLLEDVRNAKSSIHLLYYIWSEDEFTLKLKDALIERAKAGVNVRALADASCLNVSKEYLQELRAAGVKIFPYKVYMKIGRLHTANYRSHRKIVVIDGKIGYVGGMNLDKEQLPGGNRLGSWRDTHLRIEGEAAQVLQSAFAVSWYNQTKEKFDAETYFPKPDIDQLPVSPVQITLGGPDSQWKAMQRYGRGLGVKPWFASDTSPMMSRIKREKKAVSSEEPP